MVHALVVSWLSRVDFCVKVLAYGTPVTWLALPHVKLHNREQGTECGWMSMSTSGSGAKGTCPVGRGMNIMPL